MSLRRALLTALLSATMPLAAHAQARTDSTAAAPAAITPPPPAPISPPKLGGYMQVRETYQDRVGLTATLNRARLSADGALPQHLSYKVLVEYEAGGSAKTAATASLRDAYIRWALDPVTFTAGQFKAPFSREYVTSITAIETANRASVVDSLAPKRDIGVSMDIAFESNATLSLGAFNGEGQNIPANPDSVVMLVGRFVARPLYPLTLGIEAARYGSDSLRYGAEASIEDRGFLARGEVIGQHRHGPKRDDLGWFALAGYRVLPWLQFIGKQEDFQRPSLGQARRMSASTGGANFDLPGGRTRIIVDYISSTTRYPRIRKASVVAQLQVKY